MWRKRCASRIRLWQSVCDRRGPSYSRLHLRRDRRPDRSRPEVVQHARRGGTRLVYWNGGDGNDRERRFCYSNQAFEMRRHRLFCAAILLLVLPCALAQEARRVEIQVDSSKVTRAFPPIWNFFGYDEPNYTYAPN